MDAVNQPTPSTSQQSYISTASSTCSNEIKSGRKISRKVSRSSVSDASDTHLTSWARHKKHFVILSSAGKPIWSRYGDESKLSSFTGVIQAIISFFQDSNDAIKTINAGSHKFVFLLKEPLYYVAISSTHESDVQLKDQLAYLHNQIISVLTSAQLTKIFKQRVNFDLRQLLGGTEVFLDSLATSFQKDHSFMFGALEVLRLSRPMRDQIGRLLAKGKTNDLLYAMIIARDKLVTLLRPRKHSLHPSDLHILFNMLTGSTTFHTAESWTPLCLPKFNASGFLHAYICYIEKDISVVMLSTSKDNFYQLSERKIKLVQDLDKEQLLEKLQQAAIKSYTMADTGIPNICHFMYKSKAHIQFTCPDYTGPYADDTNRKRLHRLYQFVYDRMHTRSRPLKLYYHRDQNEVILGWIMSSFELYTVFSHDTSKPSMITHSNQLLRWIKKQEDNLFILNSPVF
ncbi:MON1-like protein A-like protein [Hesseltinella vesiculosa]|uniref:Vacuolar fusion protein MON1 n=1 Tax=Hesseltinella vesiculosa TaxID=101127 RepID=A0A1X2GYY0_9FUNG|nr:MON1-like protein A-like protein [Hesseltinella vesiculosa]